MIKAVIFDLDGTLVNAYPAVVSSVNHTITSLGFAPQPPLTIKRAVGMGDTHLMAHFVGEKLKEKAVRIYRRHHAHALMSQGGVRLLPGVKTLLPWLKRQGIFVAIITNRPQRFTRIIMKRLGLGQWIDEVLCADQTGKPKPDPFMLLEVLSKARVKRTQALFVGDMGIDIHTGKRANVPVVAVVTGSSPLEELKALKPFKIVYKIGQIRIMMGGST